MKHLALLTDPNKHLFVQEQDGNLTAMICPFNEKPCGYQCPHCGRIEEYGPCLGPGYFIDLSCGGHTTRLEARFHKELRQN